MGEVGIQNQVSRLYSVPLYVKKKCTGSTKSVSTGPLIGDSLRE